MLRLLPYFLMLLMLATNGTAAASDLIERVNRQLQHPPVLRGHFEQQRQLAGFSKPMISRGHFVVVKEYGALWLTDSPFVSELILTRDSLVQKHGTTVSQRLETAREPALRAINTILFALLAGDLPTLEKSFVIEGSTKAKSWTLKLIPRDATWKQVMTRIDLQGSSHIDTLKMLDSNKDTTLIRFFGSEADSTLRPDEARRFD